MDKNNNGYKLLEQIGSAVANTPGTDDITEHIRGIVRSLGAAELRSQMRSFLQSHGLTSVITEGFHNWDEFLIFLYRELIDVELAFPESVQASLMPGFNPADLKKADTDAFKVRQRIEKKAKANGCFPNLVINSFCIVEMKPDDERRPNRLLKKEILSHKSGNSPVKPEAICHLFRQKFNFRLNSKHFHAAF